MLYLVLIICLIFSFLSRENEKVTQLLFLIAILFLILFSGLRDPFNYPDIGNYYDYFVDPNGADVENFGPGYNFLNLIFVQSFSSFYSLMFAISAIVVINYAIVIRLYSPYLWLSLFLYLLINFYPSFFLLRQYLAMAVFLFSLRYVISRQPYHYGICALLALSFHFSSIVILPFYYLYGLKNSKKNLMYLALGGIACIVFFISIGIVVGMISEYYASYFERGNEEPAWQRAIMKSFVFALYLYTLREKYYNEGINRIVFYCMFFNVVICISAMNMFGVYRLREFFSLADFIGLAIILKESMAYNGVKRLVLICLCIAYIIPLYISFDRFITGGNIDNYYQLFWLSDSYQTQNI